MRLRNFRQVFTLLFSATLISFSIYAGQQFRAFCVSPGAHSRWIAIFRDTFVDDGYSLKVSILMAMLGLLVGLWVGPRIWARIEQAGQDLERTSPGDKIAVGIGMAVSAAVLMLLFVLLSPVFIQLHLPVSLQIGSFFVLGIVLIYLGIVASISMKSELVAILSRGGTAGPASEAAEMNPTLNCKILDTNVIIDGRIADVCRTGFVEGTLYVPGFVLEELQHIADSSDNLKRARGRRGLDILNSMQKELPLVVRSWDKALDKSANSDEVDTRLVKLAKALEGIIVTNDFNLNKVAALQGVQVLNINELANAIKPVVLPGELMGVAVVKEGKEPNQGIGYLDDGTMIVVEDGRRYIGESLSVVVTSVLQTVAGKMIFARVREEEDGDGFDFSGRNESGANNSATAAGGSGYPRRGPGKKIR